jgi:hypothetical protein
MKNLWGLSIEIIEELADDLLSFYQQFKSGFRTTTRDVSHHGLLGLKGSLLMEGKRTYTEVARKLGDPVDDGQNYQHFMSDSPWESQPVFEGPRSNILVAWGKPRWGRWAWCRVGIARGWGR